jgi:hypothetical protein
MHTAEPLVTEHRSFKVEISTEKLKRHKSLGTDQILAELIQTGHNTLYSESPNILIIFGIIKNCHSSEMNL